MGACAGEMSDTLCHPLPTPWRAGNKASRSRGKLPHGIRGSRRIQWVRARSRGNHLCIVCWRNAIKQSLCWLRNQNKIDQSMCWSRDQNEIDQSMCWSRDQNKIDQSMCWSRDQNKINQSVCWSRDQIEINQSISLKSRLLLECWRGRVCVCADSQTYVSMSDK